MCSSQWAVLRMLWPQRARYKASLFVLRTVAKTPCVLEACQFPKHSKGEHLHVTKRGRWRSVQIMHDFGMVLGTTSRPLTGLQLWLTKRDHRIGEPHLGLTFHVQQPVLSRTCYDSLSDSHQAQKCLLRRMLVKRDLACVLEIDSFGWQVRVS